MATSTTLTRALAAVPPGRYGGVGANSALTYAFTKSTVAAPNDGTYVTGDYWSVNSAGWTLTADLPAFSATAAGTTPTTGGTATYSGQSINGLMLNPGSVGGYDSPAQGFTSLGSAVYTHNNTGAKNYDPALNVSTGKAGPLVLAAGVEATLVKAASLSPALATSLAVQDGRPTIQGYELLTVVASAPSAGAFRPGPSASSKASWCHLADINYGRLPRLSRATLGYTIDFPSIIQSVSRAYQVWFTGNTAGNGGGSRNIAPYDHHNEYGRDVGYLLNDALCAVLTDADLETQIKPIAHGLIQIAIDIADRVAVGGTYIGNGGGDQWRLMPLLFAYALTRGTAAGARFAAALASIKTTFAEAEQINIVTKGMQREVREFVGYAVTLSSGGTGYKVNDILTDGGGDFITPVQMKVSAIGAGGAITSFAVNNTPNYLIQPTSFNPTGGSGTGASFYTVRPQDAYFPFMVGTAEFFSDGGNSASASSSDYGQYREVFGPGTPGWLIALTQFPEANTLINYPLLLEYCRRYWYMWRNDTTYGARDGNSGMHTLPCAFVNAFYLDDLSPPVVTDVYLDAMITATGTPVQAWVAIKCDRLLNERAANVLLANCSVVIGGVTYPVTQVRVWGKGMGLKLASVPPAGAGPVNITINWGSTPLQSAPGTPIAGSTFTRSAIPNLIGVFNPPVALTPLTTTGSADSAFATFTRATALGQKYYTMIWKGIIQSGAYGSLFSDRTGTNFQLFVNGANAATKQSQLRFYFMSSGKISAKPFTVPCDEMITIGLQIDLTQPNVAGLRGFYKREGHDAVIVPGASMTQPVWNPGTASFEASGGIGSPPMAIMAQGYGTSRLAGSFLYLAEAWTDTPGALFPDFSSLAVCNASDLAVGTANVDGSQLFGGVKPQGFYAAASSTEANLVEGGGILNRGTSPTSDAVKAGLELFGPTAVVITPPPPPPPTITIEVETPPPYFVGLKVSYLLTLSGPTTALAVTGSDDHQSNWDNASLPVPAGTTEVIFGQTLGEPGVHTITFVNDAGLPNPLPLTLVVGYPTVTWSEGDPLYTDHGGARLIYGARPPGISLTHRGPAIDAGFIKANSADPKLVTAPVKGPNTPPVGSNLQWQTVQPNPLGGSIVTNFARLVVP